MIIPIANPIYDSVFKYLMDDERIARTILSALLKKEVVEVTMRPHEYPNVTKDQLTMFRIDFAAKVREENGEEKTILIELQKTWLNTETLRFRQYLGAQYASKINIRRESPQGFAYPMVAIYLLGHRVGDVEAPVVYVRRDVTDYDGRKLTQGLPDPFIDSLTHESIIVQIPLIKSKPGSRLDSVLSLFDQTKRSATDNLVLDIDGESYAADSDMMRIVLRLTAAAASAEMRQDMNVEEEFFSTIDDCETRLLEKDRQLEQKDLQLEEKDLQIAAQSAQLEALKRSLSTKGFSDDEIAAMLSAAK